MTLHEQITESRRLVGMIEEALRAEQARLRGLLAQQANVDRDRFVKEKEEAGNDHR